MILEESQQTGSNNSSKNEWRRVEKVNEISKKDLIKHLSFDTRKLNLMIKGIKSGVDLINDVSGFEYDKDHLKI